MKCPLRGSVMIRDYRYKLQDAFYCGPCEYQARTSPLVVTRLNGLRAGSARQNWCDDGDG